jgi:hypothetical protein
VVQSLVNPAADDNYAVRVASQEGLESIVKRLLKDKRVDPAAGNSDSLTAAVHNCHIGVAELLLNDPRVDATAVHQHLPAAANVTIDSRKSRS